MPIPEYQPPHVRAGGFLEFYDLNRQQGSTQTVARVWFEVQDSTLLVQHPQQRDYVLDMVGRWGGSEPRHRLAARILTVGELTPRTARGRRGPILVDLYVAEQMEVRARHAERALEEERDRREQAEHNARQLSLVCKLSEIAWNDAMRDAARWKRAWLRKVRAARTFVGILRVMLVVTMSWRGLSTGGGRLRWRREPAG